MAAKLLFGWYFLPLAEEQVLISPEAPGCQKGPELMWEEEYIGSLSLLPGILVELGAAAKLEGVSLEEKDRHQWDLTSVVDIINSAVSILDSLEHNSFFLFLNNLSKVAREIKSVLALAHRWEAADVFSKVERTLRPIHGAVSCLAPKKAYGTLLDMKNFLDQAEVFDWGEDCLEHLAILHEYLEELQPGSCLSCLKNLRCLLVVHCRHLEWLANHPLIKKKLGRRNLFTWLIFIKMDLEVTLDDGDYLVEMQEMLEELDHLQAIDLHN